MAKAKLTEAAKAWVKKPAIRENTQAQAQADSGKVRHCVYISRKASKLLWQRRVDVGIPVSRTIDDLIIKHLGA